MKKIKDLFDVAKYKRQRNTIEIKYHAANEKYIELLENDRSMLNENIALKETVKQLKQEIKELKKVNK